MAHYLSIQEAAAFSKKSLQTIRRLIKTNRIKYKRHETPQGFTYLVEHNSLKNFLASPSRATYGSGPTPKRVKSITIKPAEVVETTTDDNGVYSLSPRLGMISMSDDDESHTEGLPKHPLISSSNHNETIDQLLATIRDLQAQHAQDKTKLYELLENFQRRALILEDRIKQLEAPKVQKKWYRFWR